MTATTTILLMGKRNYGSGSLQVRDGRWVGRWRTEDGKQRSRTLGLVRSGGGKVGLSKKQAAQALEDVMIEQDAAAADDGTTVEQLGSALIAQLERQGRKLSHVLATKSHLSAHITPCGCRVKTDMAQRLSRGQVEVSP